MEYIPYGEVFIEERNNTWNTPYLFNAKELDEETGLYYYGARYLNPMDGMWLSVDPLFEKYVGMSPYNYCVGNPLKLVDPIGREVKPAGDDEFQMILNTLEEKDMKYVKVNKDGCIDKDLINSHESTSENFNNLKEIVNSDYTMDVILNDEFSFVNKDDSKGNANMSYFSFDSNYPEDKDVLFQDPRGTVTGEIGFLGKTLFPDKKGLQNSPDDHIKIIINKNSSKMGAAEIYSHEANGHALLYIRNGGDLIGAAHQVKESYDINRLLVNMILKSRKETVENMMRK